MFFCTVILTELSMFCVRLSHFIIKFEVEAAQWLERSALTSAGARAYNGSLGRCPSQGVGELGAKLPEAESFAEALADIMRFTNLLHLAFYGHQKEMAIFSTSLLFQGRATRRF